MRVTGPLVLNPLTNMQSNQNAGKIPFANILRGIAVLSVLIAHYIGVFGSIKGAYGGFSELPGRPYPAFLDVLFVIPDLNYGPLGVALFFLVSGFVIPFSVTSLYGQKGWRLSFFLARFLRLWPTYFVGLMITLLSLHIAAYITKTELVTTPKMIATQLSFFRDWTGSVQMDGIVWTLEIEAKFYLLACLFASSIVFGRPYLFGLIILLTFIGDHYKVSFPNSWNPPSNFLFAAKYLTYMLIGTAFNLHFRRVISVWKTTMMVVVLYGTFALCSDRESIINYLIAFVLFSACYYGKDRINGNRFLDFFADISYPLYVLHAAFGYIGLRLMMGSGIPSLVALALQTATTVGIAFVVHCYVEAPTHRLGRNLSKKLLGLSRTESPMRLGFIKKQEPNIQKN